MYPEAGGSSSFARRAFNEFWSFFAAWAQMLTYIATIAISAFFVPHYIGGLFWEPLRRSPGDIVVGCGVIAVLAAINVFGAKESTGVNILLAVIDFVTQLLLVVVGVFLVFSPETLVDNVHARRGAEWKDFVLAIPIGMLAYTGIETISNMSEEARDEAKTIPTAINRVRIAVFAIYFTLPAVALSALPVQQNAPTGEYYTLLGLTEEEGGFAGDPILGVVKAIDLGPLQSAGEIYVGLLAATILFLATNAGIIGVSRLVYSMGIHRQMPDGLRRLHPRFRTPWIGILVFSTFAILVMLPGQEEFLGAIYSFGALLSFTMAHAAVRRLRIKLPDFPRAYRGPGNLQLARLRRAAVRDRRRHVHGGRVRRHRRAEPHGGRGRRRLARARHARSTSRSAAATGSTSSPPSRSRSRSRSSTTRPSTTPCSCRWSTAIRRARDGDRGQARGAQAARDPRARARHGPERAADRRQDARGGGGGRLGDRAGAHPGRAPRVGPHGEDPRRPGGAADHRGGDRHAGGGDRDAAAAAGGGRLAVREDARDGARPSGRAG